MVESSRRSLVEKIFSTVCPIVRNIITEHLLQRRWANRLLSASYVTFGAYDIDFLNRSTVIIPFTMLVFSAESLQQRLDLPQAITVSLVLWFHTRSKTEVLVWPGRLASLLHMSLGYWRRPSQKLSQLPVTYARSYTSLKLLAGYRAFLECNLINAYLFRCTSLCDNYVTH